MGEYGPLKHGMHYSNEVFELKLLFNLSIQTQISDNHYHTEFVSFDSSL